MPRTLTDVIRGLPPEQQGEIEAEATQLIEEELTLQDLRRARELTQERIAAELHLSLDGVARIEKRSDFLISTLRSHVEAMGGRLHLVVEFPDRKPVAISSLDSLARRERPSRGGRKPAGEPPPTRR